MNKKALEVFITLVISEYANDEVAMQSEWILFDLMKNLTKEELNDYQTLATELLKFNKKYMYKISGKHLTE